MTCLDCETFEYNYSLQKDKLHPELQPLFLENTKDQGTKEFLRECERRTLSFFKIVLDSLGGLVLRPFLSRTAFNGLLFRGGMHVLSTAQFQEHLRRTPGQVGRLLDIGAGDGGVTACMAPLFTEVVATESDRVMRWRLWKRGYRCWTPEECNSSSETFDVVACFNVLDRCDRPLQLVQRMRDMLEPVVGRIVIAAVFPFKPFVESGTGYLPPSELIAVTGDVLEDNINSFVAQVFHPCGLAVESISRAPYLCEGDSTRPYYLLHDVIFVLSAVPGVTGLT